jgi:hypothetical protein
MFSFPQPLARGPQQPAMEADNTTRHTKEVEVEHQAIGVCSKGKEGSPGIRRGPELIPWPSTEKCK